MGGLGLGCAAPTEHDEIETRESDACQAGRWSSETPRTEAADPFILGGQRAWFHDEGDAYGFFHTYDALKACAASDPRKVHVLLPRDYERSNRRYPVVYVNDGDTAFFNGGAVGKSLDLAGALSEQDPCEMEPVIAVAVHTENRAVEYTHASGGDFNPVNCCGADAYVDYLADCLKPFIDDHYRTQPDPDSNAVAGSSNGGLAAFLAGLWRSDAFGAVLAQSPSFWVGTRELEAITEQAIGSGTAAPRIYLDWGLVRSGGVQNSFIEARATGASRDMARRLRDRFGYELNRDLLVVEDPIGEHDEDSWGRRIGDAVRWSFPR